MKMRGFKVLVITMLIAVLASVSVYASESIVKTTEPYLTVEQDVYCPLKGSGNKKYPVVFIAHNGGADKSAWGDFPQVIASEGFLTVNITWKAWDTSQVEEAINYTLTKYADIIDTNKICFVGGCHGGKDFIEILNKGTDKYQVKTAVLLSVSEIDDAVTDYQKKSHVPMLVYYSLNDEVGPEYGDVARKFAEQVVTKPCKVVPQKDPAHGDNMVTKSSSKDETRKEIINWLKEYTK